MKKKNGTFSIAVIKDKNCTKPDDIVKFSGEIDITRDEVGRINVNYALSKFKEISDSCVSTKYSVKPFSNEALDFDNISIECSEDSVVIYGAFKLYLSKIDDLRKFVTIKNLLEDTAKLLEADFVKKELPKTIKRNKPTLGVNPFN